MIPIKVSQIININLSEVEAREVAIKYICERFDWQPSYFIRMDEKNIKNFVFNRVVVYSSHSFESEFLIREATDRDQRTYQVIQDIINT
jgi:hypothetical protein